ncbi:MAG: hypothetical protein PWQ20_1607 [Thermotogaceae bacterium]|uniref:Type III restriction enzyme, res subunit n=1 Tax=Thermotoga petrophila (strain ATCC BAA-488 / DSM 13995 / JCM 10881 / RKU-1) TaxID=390874 RepID=A5INJ6_THEP1|nr:DEAD/DEAH box helicase [Thermotoga petrophila]ABQ47769.1 type III restriction enzyme, res subunit [Thermotoga petrophila RKU-1]MDN5338537.1 hypothetical protein [Thermotogaceae bacterium]
MKKTCDRFDCEVCKRVVDEFFSDDFVDAPWKLSVELYRWQKEAKKAWWKNGGKGIVKVVTGAGKTIFALSLISDLFNSEAYSEGGLKVIIVVPTTVLLDQWLIEIMDKLHIPRENIGVFYGKEKENVEDRNILIYVINSARRYLKEHYERFFKHEDLFLIADECHRYGSKENSRIFEIPFSYTLGLSATPERYGDYGFEEKLVPNLGNVIYTYTYSDALKDGIIPPYKIVKLKVPLTPSEEVIYEDLTEKINKLTKALIYKYPELKETSHVNFIKRLNMIHEKNGDELITRYIALLNQRKSVIHTSKSKLYALKWLFSEEKLDKERVLIFHERIEIAEYIFKYLKKIGFAAGIYHSKMPVKERLVSISEFKDGRINVLVACKALDEGFDVPAAETGIIVAGTSSVRQWIQRMGRILRRSTSKEFSKIYVMFVDKVEKDVFTESDLLDFEKEAIKVESIYIRYTS